MLRHYDEIGLLAPARVDPVTGYRGYTIGQLRELNRIVALRGLGFSLAEVRQLLSGLTADELRGMLLLRRTELERQLAADRSRLARVEARLRAIERENELADDIVVKTAPAQRLLAVARPIPGFGPDNIAPVLNPAYDELRGIVSGLRLEHAADGQDERDGPPKDAADDPAGGHPRPRVLLVELALLADELLGRDAHALVRAGARFGRHRVHAGHATPHGVAAGGCCVLPPLPFFGA